VSAKSGAALLPIAALRPYGVDMLMMMRAVRKSKKWLESRWTRIARRTRNSRIARKYGLASKLDRLRRFVMRELVARFRRSRRRLVGDERAFRRTAERERGGISSAEAAAAFARGEIKGGTHGGKAVHFDGPEHQRPNLDEPMPRVARRPRGNGHMAERRSN
jgi:hypothetical protein